MTGKGLPAEGSFRQRAASGDAPPSLGSSTTDFLTYFLFFCFLGPHPRHMEVPRLGVQLEL